MLEFLCMNQIELASVFKEEIYKWENGLIDEQELNRRILQVIEINKEVAYKNGDFGSIIKQRLGKKRMRIIDTILKREKGERNEKH